MEASPWTKEGQSRIQQTRALRKRWTSRSRSTHSRNGQHLLDQGLGLPHCRGQPLGQTSLSRSRPSPALFQKSQKGQSFWKQSRTAGKIRLINRIIHLWVWHSFLHAQTEKILVVRPRTRLNWLLAYFPCGPAAGNGSDASCLLMEAGFHPASCGLRPRPREGFKGVLSSGCYGSLWGDHRGWGCNELVKFLAVPVTGDYIREIHIKCVFISHPSPQEPLRSFYPIIRLAVEDCACWEQAYQLEHDFFDG